MPNVAVSPRRRRTRKRLPNQPAGTPKAVELVRGFIRQEERIRRSDWVDRVVQERRRS
jgi:hypothetical protein